MRKPRDRSYRGPRSHITPETLAAVRAGLYPEQLDAVEFALERCGPDARPFRGMINAKPMGAGKTREMIYLAMDAWHRTGRGALLVADKAAQSAVKDEVRKLEEQMNTSLGVLSVDAVKTRHNGTHDPVCIYYCSYAFLWRAMAVMIYRNVFTTGNSAFDSRLQSTSGADAEPQPKHYFLVERTWSIVMFDEFHQCSNGTTTLTGIAAMSLKAEAKAGFTGTPVRHGDVSALCALFDILQGAPGVSAGCWNELRETSMLTDESSRRPDTPREEFTIALVPDPETAALFDRVNETGVSSVLKKHIRTLLEIAPGALLASDKNSVRNVVDALGGVEVIRNAPWATDDAPKIRETVRLCRKHADERIIVFCTFREPLNVLARALERAGFERPPVFSGATATDDRDGLQAAASKGEMPPIILCTLGSMSQSMTLTLVSIVIFLEQPSQNNVREQAICRAWRPGQTRRVLVYTLEIADSSIDLRNRELAERRRVDQIAVIDGTAPNVPVRNTSSHNAAKLRRSEISRSVLAVRSATYKVPPPRPSTRLRQLIGNLINYTAVGDGVFVENADGESVDVPHAIDPVTAVVEPSSMDMTGPEKVLELLLTPVPEHCEAVLLADYSAFRLRQHVPNSIL